MRRKIGLTNFWSKNGSELRTMTLYGLLRTQKSKEHLPSPLGYGFIFELNSCNSSSFMELSSNIISIY